MTQSRPRPVHLALLAVGAVALAIAAIASVAFFGSAFYSNRSTYGQFGPGAATDPPRLPAGNSGTMSMHDTPQPVPELQFEDGSGRSMAFTDFRGKVVLLNIWATWCGPCRREMPTLDRLQGALGGPLFEVLALSIDRAGLDVVRTFYAEVGIENLAIYVDSPGESLRDLGVVGLPTTLLIDRDGRELGRLVGPAEWDTDEMIEFLRRYVDETSSLVAPASRGQDFMGPAGRQAVAQIIFTPTP